MPDIRYALRNGDKTSTNGVLIGTGKSFFHHGVTIGVEGDYATCPACKAGGPVMNDCYPAFNIHGKQLLVSGARVYCKCETKPFVLPSQMDFRIEVVRTSMESFSSGTTRSITQGNVNSSEIVEQYFEITDEDGQPIEGYRYDLFVDEQQVARNRNILNGRTISVAGKHDLRLVMWLDKTGQERA